MNALDKAFIKAFAKDRDLSVTTEVRKTECHVQSKPPRDGVESVSLVLHDLYQQGKRLRVDRPETETTRLASHMILPIVEQVQSYAVEEVPHATLPAMLVEDRLAPLDEILSARRSAELACAAASTETSQDAEPGDTPTGDEPMAQAPAADPVSKEATIEQQLLAQCESASFVAAPQCLDDSLVAEQYCDFGMLANAHGDDLTTGLDITASLPDALALEPSVDLPTEPDDSPPREPATSVCGPDIERTSPATTAAANYVSDFSLAPPEPVELPRVEVPSFELFDPALPETHSSDLWANNVPFAEPSSAAPDADPVVSELEPTISQPAPAVLEPAPFVTQPAPEVSEPEPAVNESAPLADSTTSESASLSPAWEVDAFRWPQICQQLDEATDGRLTQSGEELFVAAQDGLKVVAVTSSHRQEGRSTLALALGRNAARAGCRIALVDADALNPELAGQLGMEPPCDWCEVLQRGEPLSEAAVASLEDRVTLFPLSRSSAAASAPLMTLLSTTLRELREHFDLVIVDLPPVDADFADRPSLGMDDEVGPVDMALVVRNVSATPRDQCLKSVSVLREMGVRAVGVIENFTRAPQAE